MRRLNDGTETKRSTVGVSPPLRRAIAAALVIAATSCGTDIFNFDLNLQTVTVTADFGASTDTIPPVPCNPSVPAACGEGQNVTVTSTDAAVATVNVAPGCDAATSQCFGDANVVLVQQINVLQDDAFTTRVARGSTSLVRSVDIAYT